MMHISSCDELKNEFMEIVGRTLTSQEESFLLMKVFLEMEVKQNCMIIKLHLRYYITCSKS
jgi:hypothetical protein